MGWFADRHPVGVQVAGLALNALFLAGFALLAQPAVPAVAMMLGVGLVGVTMNPAMATRVQRTGNAGPLVTTVHSSFITLGVIVGSSFGGLPWTPTACARRCGSAPGRPCWGCSPCCRTSSAVPGRTRTAGPGRWEPGRCPRRAERRGRWVPRGPDGAAGERERPAGFADPAGPGRRNRME
ncbi:hypothetical protein [Streptomyces sp. S186]|uniref:hypothetical protein n=1 Tax=Streptomyces sp. S186 TaxID=3434395 RepID=UPI003F663E9F